MDAHGDINTPATSGSGNMHGMPIAFLLGLVDNAQALPGFEWFKPCLAPRDLVYIGLRDLDSGEKKFIRDLGIKAFTVQKTFSMFLPCDNLSGRCTTWTAWASGG